MQYEYYNFAGSFPRSKRNFIKENVRQIKQMQGLYITDSEAHRKRGTKDDKFRTVPAKLLNKTESKNLVNRKPSLTQKINNETHPRLPLDNIKFEPRRDDISRVHEKFKFTSRGIQTERLEDISKLYESGVIKYPSASAGCQRRTPRRESLNRKVMAYEQGDSEVIEELKDATDNLALGLNDKNEIDHVKENIKNIKPKISRAGSHDRDPTQAPPGYQKGVLPKYLRERKDFDGKIGDSEPECPPGHILLPEEERKETLRVLRQSYADRVQELNSLPVRSDTLRMRKRKMDIEEELKKIDEGIKVFQRPKVFVKVNA